jgi:uncharacterized membrane protein YgcG
MKTLTVASLAVLSLFLLGTSRTFAAEGKQGNVRVLKVAGDVTSTIKATSEAQPLKEGTFIQQDQVIKTGKGSEAILLFSNGTTITVEQNSAFSIDKFLQTPFASNDSNYQKLKNEPSISQTKVNVSEGSIVADVVKLNKGSTFDIGTPVGVAGIRGTIIRVTVNRPGGGAPVSVTVDLPEGNVEFSAADGRTLTLADGTTVKIELAGNNMDIGPVTPMTQQEKQEIQALVDAALATLPPTNSFEGVPAGSPEQPTGGTEDQAGGFGGVQGTGNVGTPTGGSSGGGGGSSGGGSTPTPTPVPTPPTPPTL